MPDLISVGRRRGKEASDLISTLFPSPSLTTDIFPRAKLCIRPRFSRSSEKKKIFLSRKVKTYGHDFFPHEVHGPGYTVHVHVMQYILLLIFLSTTFMNSFPFQKRLLTTSYIFPQPSQCGFPPHLTSR